MCLTELSTSIHLMRQLLPEEALFDKARVLNSPRLYCRFPVIDRHAHRSEESPEDEGCVAVSTRVIVLQSLCRFNKSVNLALWCEEVNMSAPFRIETPSQPLDGSDEGFKQYLDRLLKMIPAEVIGLYLIGSGVVPPDQPVGSMIWAGICLILVVMVRMYATADRSKHKPKPPQPVSVLISSIAFVIWVYSLGGPFEKLNLYVPWIGSLAVLVWTFIVPRFYKGEIV